MSHQVWKHDWSMIPSGKKSIENETSTLKKQTTRLPRGLWHFGDIMFLLISRAAEAQQESTNQRLSSCLTSRKQSHMKEAQK
jgi:hypothetical protein